MGRRPALICGVDGQTLRHERRSGKEALNLFWYSRRCPALRQCFLISIDMAPCRNVDEIFIDISFAVTRVRKSLRSTRGWAISLMSQRKRIWRTACEIKELRRERTSLMIIAESAFIVSYLFVSRPNIDCDLCELNYLRRVP